MLSCVEFAQLMLTDETMMSEGEDAIGRRGNLISSVGTQLELDKRRT